MLISNIAEWRDDYTIYIIDGQNITQIKQYMQLNNTNNWNPCIPMPFDNSIDIILIFNKYSNFRDWYPLQICDFPNNFVNYKNEYLFDGGYFLIINNLNINNYVINDNTNYPISRNILGYMLSIQHGTFINISSMITNPLFYSNTGRDILNESLFGNISTEIILYDVRLLFLSSSKYFMSYCCFYVYIEFGHLYRNY